MPPRGRGQALDVALAGQRHHLVALGRAADQIERALPDRACGAEDGDAPQITRRPSQGHDHALAPTSRASTGAVRSRPSTRSSTPPCPGISQPLSLTPARRLSAELGKVAELGQDGEHRAEAGGLNQPLRTERPGGDCARQAGADDAAAQTGPRLTRTDRGRQAQPADAPSDQIRSGVGGPHDDQQP